MKKEENGTEEIYLMPETETAEAGKPVAVKPLTATTTASKNTEKFVFTVFYTQVDKEVILSKLKKMGAVIVRHSDKDGAVTAKMTMAQLAAIKTLECVERVEVAQTVKQSKKSLTNTETQAMLNTQQTYAATANASVSRANTNNNGVSLLCYDDGGYSGGDCSNDISTAIHLPLSTWMNGGIYCPGAEMWYRFTASVSNAAEYSIYTTGSLDTVGYLYDANGDYITENDDNDSMNFCIASELSYGATYYICVRAYGSNTGDFSLRVDYTTESSSGNDSYGDGSNDMSTAIALPLSTYVSGSVDCPGTEMWYSFTASVSNAAEYSIYTTGDLDTVGYLYDSNGDYITDNDDSGGDLNFSITSELTYGETYYVCVSAYGGNTGSYDIRVEYETSSEEPDDDGYSNDMSSAINLSLNSWHSGEIYCPGAEMWYKFTPSTTAYYTLYTVGSLDTVGHIYDADCNQLDGDDDAGAGLNFKMVARLTAGHTYYVQVVAFGDNTGYFSIAVTNTVFVEYVEIDQSYIELDKGETVTLTATVVPSYATNKTLRWETSDSSVATVNQSGVVTARGAGTACIRVYSQDGSDKSSCCEVWVDVPVQSVTINTTSLFMRVGEQENLDAEICPTDAVNQLIRWTSTDTSVVWVNAATGSVEARGEGNATVYATAQDGTGVRGSCAIQVEPPIAVQGIDICCDNYTMNVGETAYLSYDLYPADATNQDVTWCSSNPSVAEVNSATGCIVAKKGGSTTITVSTDDGCYVDSCNVSVNYCGGSDYRDVAKHTLELQNDGYYVCSTCGYRIKSPALQDKDVLNKSDYLTVVSLLHEYLSIVRQYPIYAEKMLAMTDAIRGLPGNNTKYEYCDKNGIYVPEYNIGFGNTKMYINVGKGTCVTEWVLLKTLYSIIGAATPFPYSVMVSAITDLVAQEHPGVQEMTGSDIAKYYADYLIEDTFNKFEEYGPNLSKPILALINLLKKVKNAADVYLTYDDVVNGISCTSECYNINIVTLSNDESCNLHQINYHFSDGVETMGRDSEYNLIVNKNLVKPEADYYDNVNDREYDVYRY